MNKKLPIVSYPRYIENSYERDLLGFNAKLIKLIKSRLFKFLKTNSSYQKLIRNDDFDSEFADWFTSLNAKIAVILKNYLNSLPQIAKKVSDFNFRAVKNSTGSLGKILISKTTNSTREITKLWIRENVNLITSIPRNLLENVERVVTESINLGHSSKVLAENLQKQFDISKNRAMLIARDQIGKLSGNLTRQRNLDIGITRYIWSTAKDRRVRDSHKVLDGKYCEWNDVEVYSNSIDDKVKQRSSIGATLYHPSQDIQCRCTSIAVIEGVL